MVHRQFFERGNPPTASGPCSDKKLEKQDIYVGVVENCIEVSQILICFSYSDSSGLGTLVGLKVSAIREGCCKLKLVFLARRMHNRDRIG